jgi:hypothetical protein
LYHCYSEHIVVVVFLFYFLNRHPAKVLARFRPHWQGNMGLSQPGDNDLDSSQKLRGRLTFLKKFSALFVRKK